MGLFDWLKRLLGGAQPEARPIRPSGPPRAPAPSTPSSPRPAPARPPKSRTLDLAAAQFTPITDAEALKEARRLGRPSGSNPWFGRRDLIPPVGDPRTALIDRAMVGHGFIGPEELAEIHRVGVEMDKVRPDLALAGQEAERAVARAKEDREAVKKRKKDEAAARRRHRAEAVARRRATDIVFLGRGVSAGLADRRAHVEKLQAAGLPVLAAPADVAQALGLTVPRLRWLAFHADASTVSHYVRFTIPKRSGGVRQLAAPHRDLAAAQEWILRHILDKRPAHAAAHGFVNGRSTVTNAAPHVGRPVVANADLKDFFPTITFPRVMGVFKGMGYSPAAATVLALLCTESPRRTVSYAGTSWHAATGPRALPQGACTSPALSNLVARRLDARLAGLSGKLGWTYTRYADDLTFSAGGEPEKQIGYLLARLRHIAAAEGFEVNESKTRVQRPHVAQTVTGIVVNRRPGVPRKIVRRLRAILHRARAEGLAAQARGRHPHFEAWMRGMIAYIAMVHPGQGRALRAAFDALPRRS